MMESQREIRTDGLQGQNLRRDNLRPLVCSEMASLGTIGGPRTPIFLSIVRSFPDFAALDAPDKLATGDKGRVRERALLWPGGPSQ